MVIPMGRASGSSSKTILPWQGLAILQYGISIYKLFSHVQGLAIIQNLEVVFFYNSCDLDLDIPENRLPQITLCSKYE